MTEAPPQPDHEPVERPRRLRPGCLLVFTVLVLFFMLLPCAFFFLATQEEVVIPLGDAPGQSLRIWLISAPRERGLGISTGWVYQAEAGSHVCIQTDTRFVLWAGTGEPASFCDCYTRGGPDEPWGLLTSSMGGCQP